MNKAVAIMIVDEIIADLSDRIGLGNEWGGIAEDTQSEIRETWIEIVTKGAAGL